MTFQSYLADHLRVRWQRLRMFRFAGSVLVDYRILRNYLKTTGGKV
ncbi:YlcG family protein [Salmonella enterica]|nr:YlcG family protein [Salmonella enterica]EHQ6022749.1 YlcG family protein [Salmonella enterica]